MDTVIELITIATICIFFFYVKTDLDSLKKSEPKQEQEYDPELWLDC